MKQVLCQRNFLLDRVGYTWNSKEQLLWKRIMEDARQEWFKYSRKGTRRPIDYEFGFAHELGGPYGKEVLSVGHSLFNDLIVDNFGILLAAQLLNTPVAGTIKAFNGTSNALGFGNLTGVVRWLGSGSTAPTYADFKLTTSLTTAPENTSVATTSSGYSPGTGQVTNVSTSGAFGASENVQETIIAGVYSGNSYCLMHYVYSSPVAVALGKAFTATTTITLS